MYKAKEYFYRTRNLQVNDDELVERVVGRRLDPETGKIYHLTYNRPPPDVVDRLIQRSDDTEEKLRNRLAGHHQNVKAVIGYYKQEMMEVQCSTHYSIPLHAVQYMTRKPS